MAKTRKKIREGQTSSAMDWTETNTLVMQFLASVSEEMRQREQEQEEEEEEHEASLHEEVHPTQPTQLSFPTHSLSPQGDGAFSTPPEPPKPVLASGVGGMSATASTSVVTSSSTSDTGQSGNNDDKPPVCKASFVNSSLIDSVCTLDNRREAHQWYWRSQPSDPMWG